jgi:hypothetical protein
VKPTYIGIGAQKCASTWLHRILAAHPEVGIASAKEIDFFSFYFDRGYQWYERQLSDCRHSGVAGEISPSYFCDYLAPQRIQAYAPDAKIILSLRNPVERALSNHRHEVRAGHIDGPDYSFERGLENNPMYVEQSLYAKHLRRWLQFFHREQILIILMDDVASRPATVARTVYQFVGVNPDFKSGMENQKFNRSFVNRSDRLFDLKERLYHYTRSPVTRWIWELGSLLGLKSIYRKFNQKPSELFIPEPTEQSLSQLRDIFAPEITDLEEMLGQSLESWRI